MQKKTAIQQLVAQILDGTEMELAVDSYNVSENFEAGEAIIQCSVHDVHTGERRVIEGRGVGLVDAFFHGLVDMYSEAFPSLKTIRFADFAIRAKPGTGRGARSDSMAETTMLVANSEGLEYAFVDASPSISRSAINTVLEAVEFFVNSERAFITVYKALQHARAGRRPDSEALYTGQLATLVEATSYSDVIEQIRAELKNGQF